MFRNFCLLLSLLSAIAVPRPSVADEVVVFAAASLRNAMDEVAAVFSNETGHKVVLSYAGSGLLAKQIIAGAPADIYVSANPQWMDEVGKAGLIVEGMRTDLLGNKLVLIAHGKNAAPVEISAATDLLGLLGGGKLAMALVDSVPAGQYGKSALQSLGLWDKVADHVAQGDNVRSALALVSTGEAPFGIVYATDAVVDDKVSVVGEFPVESYPPIIYPAAVLATAIDDADRQLYRALSGETAKQIFERHGFRID